MSSIYTSINGNLFLIGDLLVNPSTTIESCPLH